MEKGRLCLGAFGGWGLGAGGRGPGAGGWGCWAAECSPSLGLRLHDDEQIIGIHLGAFFDEDVFDRAVGLGGDGG